MHACDFVTARTRTKVLPLLTKPLLWISNGSSWSPRAATFFDAPLPNIERRRTEAEREPLHNGWPLPLDTSVQYVQLGVNWGLTGLHHLFCARIDRTRLILQPLVRGGGGCSVRVCFRSRPLTHNPSLLCPRLSPIRRTQTLQFPPVDVSSTLVKIHSQYTAVHKHTTQYFYSDVITNFIVKNIFVSRFDISVLNAILNLNIVVVYVDVKQNNYFLIKA